MFRRIFGAAFGAGIAVGLFIAALQHVTLVPLILEAEKYEAGAPAHKHVHDGAEAERTPVADSPWRAVLTTIATTLTAVGFALLLSGVFAVSGRDVDAREGLLWGLAGFTAFALAPAFGLPPELPGAVAADLAARQAWWIGTVAATAAGLGLIVFAPSRWGVPLAVALFAAPHLFGAPHPGEGAGSVPPELAAAFAARSLAVNALLWALLGLATGALYARLGHATASAT